MAFAQESGDKAISVIEDAEDVLPRCLKCEYILIGLPGDRCPECGVAIDWDAVELERTAALPIEERRGWGKIVGGAQTWLLVLLRAGRVELASQFADAPLKLADPFRQGFAGSIAGQRSHNALEFVHARL